MKDFKKYFNSNSAIMLLIDAASGEVVNANTSALKFYGYSQETMCSLNISDIYILPGNSVPEQDKAINKNEITKAFYQHRVSDRSTRDVQVFASPIELNERKLNFVIIQDITLLKKNEAERSRFKRIADNAIPFIGIANMDREVFYFNSSMRNAFGIPENADLPKYKVFQFYTTKGKEIIKKAFVEINEKGFWKGENEMQALDGRIYQVLQTIVLIKDEEGKPQFTSSTAIDITSQKKAEEKIAASSFHYQTLLNTASDGIHVINEKLQLVEANETFCNMLGYSGKEIMQLGIPDWDAQWTKVELADRVNSLMNQPGVFETKHRRKDGSVINVEINAVGVSIKGQNYLYASSRDITARKHSIEELRASESKFRAVLDNSFDAIGVNINGIWEMCNQATLEFFGYSSKDELIGNSILNVIAPGERERIRAYIRNRAEANKAPQNYLTLGLKKDGSVFDMDVSLSNFIQDNKPYVIVIFRNVTQHRQMEALVKESLDHLQKIASKVPGVVYQYKLRPDGTSCFPYASDAIKDIYGVTPDEVKEDASKVFANIHPDDLNAVAESIQLSAKNLAPWQYEYRVKFKDGPVKWLLGNAIPKLTEDGSVLWHGFITDITERKEVENELDDIKEKLEMAMDQSHLVYWEMDAATNIFTFNDQFYKLYATTFEKEGGYQMHANKYSEEFLFAEDQQIVPNDIARLLSGEVNQLCDEHRIRRRDGKIRHISVRVNTLWDSNGQITGLRGCNQDISERKIAEGEVIRLNNELKVLATYLQKVRATEINSLAAEVHDKLGQKLVGIKFEIDFLIQHLKGPEASIIKKIKTLSVEIDEMVKDFKKIYNKVNPSLVDDLELYYTIDSLIIDFRKKSSFEISFTSNTYHTKFEHDIKWVLLKIVEECLNNILHHAKAKQVAVNLFIQDDLLKLVIKDDGSGFDVLKLNFEKRLGIIEMRERINSIGGNIIVESEPGKGTTITVTVSV